MQYSCDPHNVCVCVCVCVIAAPEVLTVYPYDHAADWWSLGILMYTMLLGKVKTAGWLAFLVDWLVSWLVGWLVLLTGGLWAFSCTPCCWAR